MMVDARRVLGCNLERWKHEACLRWWLRHLRLQWGIWLVSGRRLMRFLLLLLSRMESRRVRP